MYRVILVANDGSEAMLAIRVGLANNAYRVFSEKNAYFLPALLVRATAAATAKITAAIINTTAS